MAHNGSPQFYNDIEGIYSIQWAPTDWRVRPFTRRGLGNQCRRGRPRSPLGSVHAGGVGLGRSARVRVHGRRRAGIQRHVCRWELRASFVTWVTLAAAKGYTIIFTVDMHSRDGASEGQSTQ